MHTEHLIGDYGMFWDRTEVSWRSRSDLMRGSLWASTSNDWPTARYIPQRTGMLVPYLSVPCGKIGSSQPRGCRDDRAR